MSIKINKRSKFRVFGLIMVVLGLLMPSVLPLFNDSLFTMHDYTQVTRLAEMKTAIDDGHLPPRWSKNLGFGYGMPLFNFYAPLPYYIGYLLMRVGFDAITAVKLLFGLTFVGSFLAMFLLARNYWGDRGALLSATVFTYLPYRALNVYVRGALGELFGMMMLTWGLWALTKLVQNRNRGWIVVTGLLMGGFLTSHTLMILMGLPLILAYALYLIATSEYKLERAKAFTLALILGFGLSAYFVIPMIAEQAYTSVAELTKLGGEYQKHFVFARQLLHSPWGYGGSIEGLMDGISFELGILPLILTAAGIITVVKLGNDKLKRVLVFGVLGIGLSLFLTNIRSGFLWAIIPQLAFVQFPWRFIFFAGLLMSLIAGGVSLLVKNRGQKVLYGMLIVLVVITLSGYFKPENYAKSTDDYYRTDEEYIQKNVSRTLPEYIHPRFRDLVLANQNETLPIAESRYEFLGEEGRPMEVVEDKTHKFTVKVWPAEAGILKANIFAFPGWKFFVDHQEVVPQVDMDFPVYRVPVPNNGGEGIKVSGRLTETPVRMTGNLVTLGSFGIIFYVLLKEGLRRLSKVKG